MPDVRIGRLKRAVSQVQSVEDLDALQGHIRERRVKLVRKISKAARLAVLDWLEGNGFTWLKCVSGIYVASLATKETRYLSEGNHLEIKSFYRGYKKIGIMVGGSNAHNWMQKPYVSAKDLGRLVPIPAYQHKNRLIDKCDWDPADLAKDKLWEKKGPAMLQEWKDLLAKVKETT
jgi:hypothetical protein